MQRQLGLFPGSESGGYSNGRLYCRFQKEKNVPITSGSKRRRSARQATNNQFTIGHGLSYYVLLANGPSSNGTRKYCSLFKLFISFI